MTAPRDISAGALYHNVHATDREASAQQKALAGAGAVKLPAGADGLRVA